MAQPNDHVIDMSSVVDLPSYEASEGLSEKSATDLSLVAGNEFPPEKIIEVCPVKAKDDFQDEKTVGMPLSKAEEACSCGKDIDPVTLEAGGALVRCPCSCHTDVSPQ